MNAPATVTPITRMTADDYETRRAELRATYGDSKGDAGGRYEQELAKLFAASGWTQEQLAKKEGKSRPYIARMLLLGAFLNFVPDRHIPANLTEWKFRGYWSQTERDPNERVRFAAVAKLIEADQRIGKTTAKKTDVSKPIINKFADGRWHKLDAIASEIGKTNMDVAAVLDQMRTKGTHKCHCERRKSGKSYAYRIIKGGGRKVDMEQLQSEVKPILQELKTEIKKSYAVYSPQRLETLIDDFERALEALAK